MIESYKSSFSINIDEAFTAGILRKYFRKNAEVFIPLNMQLKDVDLIVSNIRNKKTITIQVKGSRAYEPKDKDLTKFGKGSNGWFFIKKELINRCTADYFIFIINVIEINENKGRRSIKPHLVTIKPKQLIKICRKQKILHKNYSFYVWINPKEKKAYEYRDAKQKGTINLSRYLDEKGFNPMKKSLGIK